MKISKDQLFRRHVYIVDSTSVYGRQAAAAATMTHENPTNVHYMFVWVWVCVANAGRLCLSFFRWNIFQIARNYITWNNEIDGKIYTRNVHTKRTHNKTNNNEKLLSKNLELCWIITIL